MKILTERLESFTSQTIIDFVKENHPEGVELDYKEGFPKAEKLSELVASFANTRGGVILIGVKENRESGRPIKSDGVKDGHHDEFIAQVVGNIKPIPAYQYHKTDPDEKGNVFVLVRIFEGYETPYYPHNDSNLWIRTGTIKKPVDLASPEAAELLFKKSERADKGRSINVDRVLANFKAFELNAEKERVKEIEIEKEEYEAKKRQHEYGATFGPLVSRITPEKLGSNTSMLSITIQPYYPHGQLIRPLDLEQIIRDSHFEDKQDMWQFPFYNNWDSTSDGMSMFTWGRHNGEVTCQQVFANGLIYSSHDVRKNRPETGRYTHLAWFTSELYVTLKGAYKILSKLGYQGTLIGEISIKDIAGIAVYPILRTMFDDDVKTSVYDCLSWKISTDTTTLSDDAALEKFVTELSRDIHWSFGYKDLQKNITVDRLKKERYLS